MGVLRGFEVVALRYPYNQPKAILINQQSICSSAKVDFCCSYIADNGIEQADIICDDLAFLNRCPSLKHLRIRPSPNATKEFDFAPLYNIPEVLSLTVQNEGGPKAEITSKIDYLRVNGLVDLFVRVNKGTLNYNKLGSIKSLRISGFKGKNRNLTDMFCSTELDTLEIIQSGIESLDGIEVSQKMQCLYLSYNRSLSNINALKNVKSTLRALRIVNCPKIMDFSVLSELESLELLELTGNNVIPDFNFIKQMKSLKTLVFSINVQNGDISPCLGLSYVSCSKFRKHYNVPTSALPKGQYYRGNDNIEEWRRLE